MCYVEIMDVTARGYLGILGGDFDMVGGAKGDPRDETAFLVGSQN